MINFRLQMQCKLFLLLVSTVFVSATAAENDKTGLQANAPTAPLGQFVTLKSPLTDLQVANVGNTALELQARADRENRSAVLVLEIPPGTSRMGQVTDLARRLTSADLSRVKIVAWIPKTVTGHHAILALIAREIVMHPEASLGDVGSGQAVAEVDQNLIFALTNRRNHRVSRGLAKSMMDPATVLMRVRTKDPAGQTKDLFLTQKEVRSLPQDTLRTETETIKDLGAIGLYPATEALKSGFLVNALADNRRDVAQLFELRAEAMREKPNIDSNVKAVIIPIHGVITPLTEEFVRRSIRTSLSDGANLLIFDIDSPGGYADSSFRIADFIASVDPEQASTVAWIQNEAISGAAISALGADHIVLTPDGTIGDAGVIQETQEGGAFERAPEKLTSKYLVDMQNLAERKGRSTALIQAMMDANLQVYKARHPESGKLAYMSELEIKDSDEPWEQGALVPESRKGNLLTVNGNRAYELGLADAPAKDLQEVQTRFGVAEDQYVEVIQHTWVDTFVFVLQSGFGGFALISLAIFCLYLEAHLPSGFFGICSFLCFSLFFWSRYLGGTAGSLEVMMFLIGLSLLGLELFVVPGFGVFGISGFLLVGGALVMASHTFSGMSTGEKFHASILSIGNVCAAMLVVIGAAVVTNRYLPSIPLLNKLAPTPPGQVVMDGPQLKPSVLLDTTNELGLSVGNVGKAESTLRPAGKASFGHHFIDVVSDGGYIDHDTEVEIVRIAGNRIVVRPTTSAQQTSTTDA